MNNEKINKGLVIGVVALVVLLLASIFANQDEYNVGYRHGLAQNFNKICTVPSPKDVNNYCIAQGYQRGWVTQTCEENQVNCHRFVGTYDENKCIDIRRAI